MPKGVFLMTDAKTYGLSLLMRVFGCCVKQKGSFGDVSLGDV